MKGVLKNLICTVLMLSCILVFAGCSNNVSNSVSNSGQEEATAAAKGFMDSIVALDADTALTYVDDTSSIDLSAFSALTFNNMFDEALASSPEMMPFKDKFQPFFDKIIEKVKADFYYKITGVEQDGSDYVFNISITALDSEKTGDIESMLQDSMSEYLTEDGLLALTTELFSSGTITASSSQEEIIGAVLDKIMPDLIAAIDNLEIQTFTMDGDIVVSNKDGKWLVNVEKSNLN